MDHSFRIAVFALTAFALSAGPIFADEATMRMRGGTQTFVGDMISFDGESFLVETPVFGKVYLDAKRFECIAGACPQNVTSNTSDTAVPAGNPATPTTDNVTPREDYAKSPSQSKEDKQRQLFMEFLEWRKGQAN